MPGTSGARTAPGGPRASDRRATARVVAVVAAVAVLAVTGWAVWSFLDRPLAAAPDRAELIALRSKLDAVKADITPIAVSFTSRPSTQPIDLNAYERRIDHAGSVVESVNGVAVTSSRALGIRDSILNGGSDVLAGFRQALGALQSDDASATDSANALVDKGVIELDSAQQALDRALGAPRTKD